MLVTAEVLEPCLYCKGDLYLGRSGGIRIMCEYCFAQGVVRRERAMLRRA